MRKSNTRKTTAVKSAPSTYSPPLKIVFHSCGGSEITFIRRDGAGHYWYEYTKVIPNTGKKIGDKLWFTEELLKRTLYWLDVTKSIKPAKLES
jgi:hypothetical protein